MQLEGTDFKEDLYYKGHDNILLLLDDYIEVPFIDEYDDKLAREVCEDALERLRLKKLEVFK